MEYIAIFGLAAIVLVTWSAEGSSRKTSQRDLRRVEKKLDRVLESLGLDVADPQGIAEVDALLAAGKTVDAVRKYRAVTGASLLEAKQAVDRRAAAR